MAMITTSLLNQACTSQRPEDTWFLEIAFVHNVCMRVCVCTCVCVCAYVRVRPPPRLLITSGVI